MEPSWDSVRPGAVRSWQKSPTPRPRHRFCHRSPPRRRRCRKGTEPKRPGRTRALPDGYPEKKGSGWFPAEPAPLTGGDLENARTVVVGGAGLGSMENFGQARQLAAALAGQVAATRPPVLRSLGGRGSAHRPDRQNRPPEPADFRRHLGSSPVYRRHHGIRNDRGDQPGSCRTDLPAGGHRCGCRCTDISAPADLADPASGHAPVGR
jgi:hypothetical protein